MSVENQAITEALACNEGSASDDRKGKECTLGQCKRKEAWIEVEIEFEIEIENWNRETAECDAESSSAWRLEFDFWNLEFKNLLLKNHIKKSLRVILNSDSKFKIVSRSITRIKNLK